MIVYYPFKSLGNADHGWLKANHHFSFAHYYDPKRMGFGVLRVINDDWIAAAHGFPAHPHNNMEIITFVRSGAISHQDSEGNKGVTRAGEVQVMSAGSGIVHSEYNHEKVPSTLYQIWIESNKHDVQPRWETKRFDNLGVIDSGNNGLAEKTDSQLSLVVSGYQEDKADTLFIHQEARVFAGQLKKGQLISQQLTHQGYVLASKGQFEMADGKKSIVLEQGDGAEVTKVKSFRIKALTDMEVLVIDAPLR